MLLGTYNATLTASSTGCTAATANFPLTVSEPANNSTSFCGFGSSANLAGGNLSHRDDIISVNGGLLPLALSIDYNSQDPSSGSLGPGWRHSLDITLTAAGDTGNGLLLREGGVKKLYTYDGSYHALAGDHSVLTGSPGTVHDLTYRNGTVYHFLANGQLDTITDRYGNRLTFGYSGGVLTSVTDSHGQQLTFYHNNGWLERVDDPKGNQFTFTPQNGRLWRVTNPQTDTGITTSNREYLYDTNGLLASRRDPNGNLTQYTIDGTTKRVATSIDPDGSVNPQYHTRTISYPPSYSTTMTTSFKEKDDGIWSYTFDTQKGTLTSVTAPVTGKTTNYYYDSDGNLKAITVPYSDITKYTTFYSYDSYGNLLTETDPVDISIYGSNLDPNTATPASLAALNPPINTAVSYAWDTNDRITQISNMRDDTTALTTTIEYTTEAGTGYELTKIIDPESKATKIRRNPTDGKVMELEDGNGNKTVFTYYPVNPTNTANGSAGMLNTVTGPDSVKTTYVSYDRDGNPLVIQMTDANNNPIPVNTQLAYDALNRLRSLSRTLTNQGKTLTGSYDYSQYGTLTVKDPEQTANNRQGSTYEFNYNRNVKRITDAISGVTELTYGGKSCPSCGGVDQLTAVKDPRQSAQGANGKSTMFLYDQAGRLEKETDPIGKIIRYTYYDNSQLKGKYDATGGDPGTLLMSYTYNPRGQLTEKLRSDGSKDSFTYKTNGFLETATTRNPDNSVLISYTFDWYKNGWLKSVIDTTNSRTINYDLYDDLGQRKTVTYFPGTADQRVVTYDYDTANRPWHIYDPNGTFTFGYDERGRRKTLVYPNPTPGNRITATYGYDDLDQLTSLSHVTGDSTTIVSFTYPLYDNAGNRTNKTITGSDPETYIYDLLYRIWTSSTPVGSEVFTYDGAGNRLSGPNPTIDTRYVADDSNRMTRGRLLDYGYDNRGNQTTRTVPSATDKTWTQYWDSEDRLTKVEKIKETRDAQGVLQRTDKRAVTFSYDPFGRRIGKIFTITKTIGGTTTTLASSTWKYFYDNEDIVLETYTEINKPAETTLFTHGPGIDEPLALTRGSQYYTYHADGLGSIVAIAGQTKNVVERYSYDTYGLPTPSYGFRNAYTYTARELDKEASLLFYRTRYRDLLDGNFIGKDKLGFAAGDVNLWNYVSGNPGNFTDPSGLATYQVNRKLGGAEARSTWNPATHTFIAVTNAQGKVINTYSWGNVYNKDGFLETKWAPLNMRDDVLAATMAIKTGNAYMISDGFLDKYVSKAYSELSKAGYERWSPFDSCKHKAKALLDRAIELSQ